MQLGDLISYPAPRGGIAVVIRTYDTILFDKKDYILEVLPINSSKTIKILGSTAERITDVRKN